MSNKKTVIIGASTNSSRYSHRAVSLLKEYDHTVIPLGIVAGTVADLDIIDLATKPKINDVHTVSMYINPSHQEEWSDYIISLKPKRIIFNPGTENSKFDKKATKSGIEVVYGCTLVMLRTDQY